MTTLVRTRNPLETLSMSQPSGRRRSKRLAAYNEEDGDFVFTRGSKRTRTALQDVAPLPEAPPTKKSKQKPKEKPEEKPKDERDHGEPAAKKARGRKMSFSTPKKSEDVLNVPKRGTRKSTRLSTENGLNANNKSGVETDLDSIEMVGMQSANETSMAGVEVSKQSTTIPLPFSDTPMANRNKEFRKKGAGSARRSSLGMRGRRASSLIENGHSAIPHREVEVSEFYKHIEADGLCEPRRMKQLLTWTGERALGEKKAAHGDPDSGAILAARVIQEGLLKDIRNDSEFSDWFSREDSAPAKVVMKPNPRNLEVQESIAEIEPRIKRLQMERDHWKSLLKPQPSLPPLFPDSASKPFDSSFIDSSLLDPEQANILSTISKSSALDTQNQTSKRLKDICSSLEFKIDELADGVHKAEQFQATAGRIADKILALSAVSLEERERIEKEEIGTRDVPIQEVLRSLSRILPEGGAGSGR